MKVSFFAITTFACVLLGNRVSQANAARRRNDIAFHSLQLRRRSSGASKGVQRKAIPADTLQQHVEQYASIGVVGKTLARGAFLRVASDLSGGTPLETIKCRVTTTEESPMTAIRNIGSIENFWTGTPTRTIEGALLGALFLVGSTLAKEQTIAMGASPTMAALSGGLVGGLVQAIVMTPAGMIVTSLNVNRNMEGYENDTAITVTKRILEEEGVRGMFIGGGPMAIRQATNWMSRSYFTEVARSTFRLSEYGLIGEIGSGVIGGLGSCWNTPIETIRVSMQADVSAGRKPKSSTEYWDDIKEDQGIAGLFRGVNPRGIQAIWQTVFMVVVPNLLGL